jgi:hypothetical protein
MLSVMVYHSRSGAYLQFDLLDICTIHRFVSVSSFVTAVFSFMTVMSSSQWLTVLGSTLTSYLFWNV